MPRLTGALIKLDKAQKITLTFEAAPDEVLTEKTFVQSAIGDATMELEEFDCGPEADALIANWIEALVASNPEDKDAQVAKMQSIEFRASIEQTIRNRRIAERAEQIGRGRWLETVSNVEAVLNILRHENTNR